MKEQTNNKYTTEVIKNGFSRLFSAGFVLGVLGGAFAMLIPKGLWLFDGMYAVTVFTLAVVLWLFFRQEEVYWQDLLHTQPNTAIGQALGVSVFGVLLAMTIMVGLLLLIPYLFGIADWPAFKEQVGNAFGTPRLFLLVVVTASVAAVSLYKLKQ